MFSGKYINEKVELFTNFRTKQDVEKLISMLNNCFGLICSINEPKIAVYVVVISKESVKLLQTIVLPFIVPSMKHKIGLYIYSTSYSHRVFLGNQRSKYTTLNSPSQQLLNPNYITGFADASQKSIVVFGTNLTSTVGIKFSRTQLAIIKLTPYQYNVIIGLLLSDG
jgi:hypothetical protein